MDSQYVKNKKLPDHPGVYMFVGEKGEILYIGKATSIKDRVRSYFASDIVATRGPLIHKLIVEAKDVKFETTDSVLEALILEANLIKKYQPIYNTREKDNKSFNYVVITDEDFPRVLLLRGRELEQFSEGKLLDRIPAIKKTFGPFTQGASLKEALKLIRRIFTYRDTCTPVSLEKKTDMRARPCFNRQIGLCPGVCTGEVTRTEYNRIVRHIVLFFEGKKSQLLSQLTREMKSHAKLQQFEKAQATKKIIFALNHIKDVSLIKKDIQHEENGKEYRVEGYDIAHLGGDALVGVMTVVVNHSVDKSQYRKFKINRPTGINDTAALKEVLERRFEHNEWQFPDLIVVDGGIAQKNIAEAVLEERNLSIPVAAVVKNNKHKPERLLSSIAISEQIKNDVLLVNNEAHRFAITYHRKKLRKRG